MATMFPLLFLAATVPLLPVFHTWASTPPMGWNSWDCFGTTVTEAQVRAQADFMAAKLKAHGWQYIVVDIQWYEPECRTTSPVFSQVVGARGETRTRISFDTGI
jgi:hypothetical protein